MAKNGLMDFLRAQKFQDILYPMDDHVCDYYDEDGFNSKQNSIKTHLNIFSMNIRSLPKHGGELLTLINMLNTKFHVIVLTEIGARNLSLVEHLMPDYTFHYVIPATSAVGGVGIYVSDDLTNISVVPDHVIKTCNCHKCIYESLLIHFSVGNNEYSVAGIYRHPGGNLDHFVTDLENSLQQVNENKTCIVAGDINIDIIKYDDHKVLNYLTAFLSKRYLPYITLPTRISFNRPTGPTATCIDHIFIRFSNATSRLSTYSGMLYSDITITYHAFCLFYLIIPILMIVLLDQWLDFSEREIVINLKKKWAMLIGIIYTRVMKIFMKYL